MNIVIATDYAYVNGGASKIALGSALGLVAAGHRVVLFTAVGPIDPALNQTPGLTVVCANQFEILSDPNRARAAWQGLWNTKVSRMMDDLLSSLDPLNSVVHVHSWTKALSSSVVRAAVKRGTPVIVTLHDFFVVCPNGTLFNHRQQQVCSLKPMSAHCWGTNCDTRNYQHKLWRVARQLVQENRGLIPSGCNEFLSISDINEEIIRPLLPRDARIHRVRNFIEAIKGPRVDVGSNSTFVYMGRFVREKGVMLWAECARKLNISALFIGEGDLGETIKSQYPEIKTTGWLSAAEITTQLRHARALVFPSLWHETQGLVVAEAAAMGIPSIVSDCSGAREWVMDGKTGLLFHAGDITDLAQKVIQLRDSADLAEELGREAYREFWENPPTLKSHVAELESVYRSILGELQTAIENGAQFQEASKYKS